MSPGDRVEILEVPTTVGAMVGWARGYQLIACSDRMVVVERVEGPLAGELISLPSEEVRIAQ